MDFTFLPQHFQLSKPLEFIKITQGFGENKVDFYKELGMKGHNGIDYWAAIGTVGQAMIDGKVTVARTDSTGGMELRYVTDPINHNGGIYRLEIIAYHLSGFLVEVGDRIARGQDIFLTGNTGKWTTGAHLHGGLKPQWMSGTAWKKDWDNGYFGAIDPLPFIDTTMPEYENPYNLQEDTLVQLTENLGGFAWYTEGRLYVDDLDKILASFIVANSGGIEGKAVGVAQIVWDAYPHYNLKKQLISKTK